MKAVVYYGYGSANVLQYTKIERPASEANEVLVYLNPPDRAIVLCVDEKSQVQALDRTRPVLPLSWCVGTADT
jgi:NADPH:quinone reductase-like Zn-dependent oxidoreductase